MRVERKLEEVEFTIFDTETTGLEPESGDRVVELAALRLKGGKELAVFESLVNPRRQISPAAFQVNRITPEMLSGAPGIEKVLPEFLRFIAGSCLCSYNAVFDLGFLENEIRLCRLPALNNILAADILKMARRLLPALGRYSLGFVAESLGIKARQEHRALSDVRMTREIFLRLTDTLGAKGTVSFPEFLSLFGVDVKLAEEVNAQKVSRIQEAIGLGVRLKIRYLSSGAAISEREVEPKEIIREHNRAYLVGHCCLRNEERTFRLDGILHLEIL
jgi:DNA polymerase III epsilon subunit family exonuclease